MNLHVSLPPLRLVLAQLHSIFRDSPWFSRHLSVPMRLSIYELSDSQTAEPSPPEHQSPYRQGF